MRNSVECCPAPPSALQAAYLQSLGITAVELLPVFEWDELEFRRSPNPRDHMTNVWGYSHINFFAPCSRLGAGGRGPEAAAKEFKDMVKTWVAGGRGRGCGRSCAPVSRVSVSWTERDREVEGKAGTLLLGMAEVITHMPHPTLAR